MNLPPAPHSDGPPLGGSDYDTYDSLEVFAEISGVSVQRIQYYLAQGLLRSDAAREQPAGPFDTRALRNLRQIEHVRVTCDLNTAGVRLVHQLLTEIDRLQTELRRRPPPA